MKRQVALASLIALSLIGSQAVAWASVMCDSSRGETCCCCEDMETDENCVVTCSEEHGIDELRASIAPKRRLVTGPNILSFSDSARERTRAFASGQGALALADCGIHDPLFKRFLLNCTFRL